MVSKFTPERRAAFVEAIGEGSTVPEAAVRIGVKATTATNWVKRGRKETGTPYAAFAADVERARKAGFQRVGDRDELEGLLWQAARRGSVRASQLLLERPWERQPAKAKGGEKKAKRSAVDELAGRRAARRAA